MAQSRKSTGKLSRNCKNTLETMGNSLKQKRSTRWNLIWRSEHFREGGGRRGSDAPEFYGCCLDSAILEQFIAMGAPRRTHQVIGPAASASCSGASSPCARRTEGKEQPETWRSRRRGTTEKCSETCVWRTSAREGFPAGSVFDPTLIPNNGICEGDAGEFDSTSGGEETRGRQSAAKGNTSMTKTRSRSPRGEL